MRSANARNIINGSPVNAPAPQTVKMDLTGVTRVHESRNGSVKALDGISLQVYSEEILCVLGPSGCGKSTLLNLMAGLDKPTQGEIRLHGNLVTGPGTDRVVIFQEAALFPWLNVLENVEFGLKMKGVAKSERHDRAYAALKLVHLDEFSRAYSHQLSGGMKQRAALARGLVLDPEMLLMDEPFAALDAQTRDVLHQELQEISARTKKTIVFVTHNVREAACLGDRIILLGARPGRVRREYAVDIKRPRYIEDAKVMEIARTVVADLREESKKVERTNGNRG
jgi:NitT/TauT family transport system ATP-binding protein